MADDRVASRKQRPDFLVGLDPGRREVRVLEHPVGERPLARGGVVDEGQPLALVRQIVEGAGLLGLANLLVDEALTGWRERIPEIGALLGHDGAIVSGLSTPAGPATSVVPGNVARRRARVGISAAT